MKLQKLPSFHVFLPQNVFMHVIDLKMFSTCSLDQGKHVTYPQHDVICHEVFLMPFEINLKKKIVKDSFFTSNLEVLKSWYLNTSKFLVKKEIFTIYRN